MRVKIPLIQMMGSRQVALPDDLESTFFESFSDPPTVNIPKRRIDTQEEIFIVEPHMDDALLSLGGFLMSFRGVINVITVFSLSQSCHPSLSPLLKACGIDTSILRNKETRTAMKAMNATWRGLGFDDSLSEQSNKTLKHLAEVMLQKVKSCIPISSTVFLPAGMGAHPHHVLVASLATHFNNVVLYEDASPIPLYSRITDSFWPRYDELLSDFHPIYLDISSSIENKIRLLSIYRSQFTSKQVASLLQYHRAVAISSNYLDSPHHTSKYHERVYINRRFSSRIQESLHLIRSPRCQKIRQRSVKLPLDSETHQLRAFHNRQSSRDLTGQTIELKILSSVLQLSCRSTGHLQFPYDHLSRYPYPTAGGLGSTRVYLLNWNVVGIKPGLYRYDAKEHCLRFLERTIFTRTELCRILEGQDWAFGATFALVLSGDMRKIGIKYGNRAGSLMNSEIGHCSQVIQMACTQYDLSCVFVGGFRKEELRQILEGTEPHGIILASPRVPPSPKSKIVSHVRAENTSTTKHKSYPFISPLQETQVEIFSSEPGKFIVARASVPFLNHWSTGVAYTSSKASQGMSVARKLAIAKAVSEAYEILAAHSHDASDLILSSQESLNEPRVLPSEILLDAIQAKAVTENRTVPGLKKNEIIHWIRGFDTESLESIWLPCDAVLLGRRFFDWKILPTSSGLAAATSFPQALSRAKLETIEKRLVPRLSASRMEQSLSKLDNVSKSLYLKIKDLFCEPTISTVDLGKLYYSQSFCPRTNYSGTAVASSQAVSIQKSLAELLSKLIYGTKEDLLLGESHRRQRKQAMRPVLASYLARFRIHFAFVKLKPSIASTRTPNLVVVRVLPYSQINRSRENA